MLLLYRCNRLHADRFWFIYIPLCFYFILTPLQDFQALLVFTFHYASTLSSIFNGHNLFPCQFTFHYASTLSFAVNIPCSNICCIYIPLCFYFIPARFSNLSHFVNIYIPLCFYFIRVCHKAWDWELLFTFHYASTLSLTDCLRWRIRESIYIPLCFYFIEKIWDMSTLNADYLHSTMLLLYRSAVHPGQHSIPIYIPLCFYFIKYAFWDNAETVLFTFHYASTLSISSILTDSDFLNLHSTMLLLYLEALKGNPPKANKFTFHYASTLS